MKGYGVVMVMMCVWGAGGVRGAQEPGRGTPLYERVQVPGDVQVRRYAENSLCGVNATYLAMRRQGKACSLEEVLKKMPPSVYGSSMHQISEFLKEHGVRADAVRCTTAGLGKELRANREACAIINVGDHWVFVSDVVPNGLEVVDYPRKSRMPNDVIEMMWDGYAVIIGSRSRETGWLGTVGVIGTGLFAIVIALWWVVRRIKGGGKRPCSTA